MSEENKVIFYLSNFSYKILDIDAISDHLSRCNKFALLANSSLITQHQLYNIIKIKSAFL